MTRARAAIRKAVAWDSGNRSLSFDNVDSNSFVYRNPRAFYLSYLEMERRLKVYVYDEGELPIVHDGPCKDIYTIEGRFIHEIEQGAGQFRTRDQSHAHVDVISTKNPFWNREQRALIISCSLVMIGYEPSFTRNFTVPCLPCL